MALATPAFAAVTRTITPRTGGATITYTWDAAAGLASSLIIHESLPPGANLSIAAGSKVTPKAVRHTGNGWSFLIARANAIKAGSFSCIVAYSTAGTAVGGWTGMNASGARLAGGIAGASALTVAAASTGGGTTPSTGGSSGTDSTQSGGVDSTTTATVARSITAEDLADFAITSFSIEPSSSGNTIRFSWTGAGDCPVDIQYAPVLSGDASANGPTVEAPQGVAAARRARAAEASTTTGEWASLKTVDPASTYGVGAEPAPVSSVRAFSVGGAQAVPDAAQSSSSSMSDTIYSYAIKSDAPSGFFRLTVKVPESSSENK